MKFVSEIDNIITGLEDIPSNKNGTIVMDASYRDYIVNYLKTKVKRHYESRKKEPCSCGRKRIELWFSCNHSENRVFLKCPNCGKRTLSVRTELEAIKEWNKIANDPLYTGMEVNL